MKHGRGAAKVVQKTLFTIGYEGAESADFLATLQAWNVALVIDVRELPLSRKRGFSKKALGEALASRGITYLHLKELGDPKLGREAARRGDFETFENIFDRQMKSSEGRAALGVAMQSADDQVSCLLCYERAHENCHRSIVAKALAEEGGFAIRHLDVQAGVGIHHTHHKNGHVRANREIALG